MRLRLLLPILIVAAGSCREESGQKKPDGESADATTDGRFSGSCFEQPSTGRDWPLCRQYDNVIKDPKARCHENGGVWSDDPCTDSHKVAGCKIVGSTISNPQPVMVEWIYEPGTVSDAKEICGEGDNQSVILP